jgi:hypothetical protein
MEGNMAVVTFSPPGFVDDLDPSGRQAWHDLISDFMDSAHDGDPTVPFSAPRPQFFNPAKTAVGVGAATEDVKWTAFPRCRSAKWQRSPALAKG